MIRRLTRKWMRKPPDLRELANAKHMQDILGIRGRYAQTQMQAYAQQAQELGNLIGASFAKHAVADLKPGRPHAVSTHLDKSPMNESIMEIHRLIQEIVAHLNSGTKTDARRAVAKLERIAAVASTAALTIQIQG